MVIFQGLRAQRERQSRMAAFVVVVPSITQGDRTVLFQTLRTSASAQLMCAWSVMRRHTMLHSRLFTRVNRVLWQNPADHA